MRGPNLVWPFSLSLLFLNLSRSVINCYTARIIRNLAWPWQTFFNTIFTDKNSAPAAFLAFSLHTRAHDDTKEKVGALNYNSLLLRGHSIARICNAATRAGFARYPFPFLQNTVKPGLRGNTSA